MIANLRPETRGHLAEVFHPRGSNGEAVNSVRATPLDCSANPNSSTPNPLDTLRATKP